MATGVKLRRVSEATSAIKAIAPELIELLDKNFWDIETGLTSVGAITGSPGGGSGGTLPGGTISHHSLLDLTTFDDHLQYILGAGRVGGQHIVGGINAADRLFLRASASLGVLQPIDIQQVGVSFSNTILRTIADTGQVLLQLRANGGLVIVDPTLYSSGSVPVLGALRMHSTGTFGEMFVFESGNAIGNAHTAVGIGFGGQIISYSDGSSNAAAPNIGGNTGIAYGQWISSSFTRGAQIFKRVNGLGIIFDFVDILATQTYKCPNFSGTLLLDTSPVLSSGTVHMFPKGNANGPFVATWNTGSKVVTALVGYSFATLNVGDIVYGPGIGDFNTITNINLVANPDELTLKNFPTGNNPGGIGGDPIWAVRGFQLYGGTGGRLADNSIYINDGAATYTALGLIFNHGVNDTLITIPTLAFNNEYSKGQRINISGTEEGLWIKPNTGPSIWIDDGAGAFLFRVLGQQAISGAPDKWHQAGSLTPALVHSLLYTSSDRNANWPDVDGTVVISPTPLTNLNTSANVVGGTLHPNASSNVYFRVSLYLITHTAGDRNLTLDLKWTDNVGAKSQRMATFLLTAGGKIIPPSIVIFVASGDITYDLTFSGTTGTADVRAIVERMS